MKERMLPTRQTHASGRGPVEREEPSSGPSFNPYYGSIMRYTSQTPPFNAYMSMGNENVPSVGAPEFPELSTQITLGGMTDANEVTSNPEDSTPNRKKN
ncbi:hypothetical protein MTR_3g053400 [Medicago truncatula]|uniref:Uncharacterized protein n=1 Tax=Medicago truncatula TaxID=3880 RepID=A0A072UWE0_MEDTR|nr:hypothetical protein MTR_3g053400 [Medicago truncatula]